VVGLGGSPGLGRTVGRTRLGQRLWCPEDEEWWLTVIQWLVNRPELPRGRVGPVVDYLGMRRNRDPEISMKGRSVPAVLRLVEEWHRELAVTGGVGHRALPSGLVAAPSWLIVDTLGKVWTLQEIADTRALYEEGREMSHCVFGYYHQVVHGESSIWSLRLGSGPDARRAVTLEVRNASRRIVQARGFGNRNPTPDERWVLRRWAEEHDLKVAC
jgi:hypothetical protein